MRPSEALGCGLGVALAAAVIAFIVGVIHASQKPDDGPDATAKLACTHFRNVMDDISDGVLTDAQIQAKAKQVDANASASSWPGLAEASRDFLAAVTTGGDAVSAASHLADVCSNVPSL